METSASRPQPLPLSIPAAVAHLVALSGFAVAQPLFDLLSRQAEFLVAHDVQPIDLVSIALAPSVVLPLGLALLARSTAWLSRSAWQWIHLLQVAGLFGLITLQVLKRLTSDVSGGGLLATAIPVVVIATVGYARRSVCRTFLTVLSPVALIFPLLFLLGSPIREMLAPVAAEAIPGPLAETSTPVVMVILDELPLSSLLDGSGEIDPDRYPNLASLAGDAYWFRDATTVANGTTLSVPIILSGLLPEDQRLPRAAQYPDNLFTWLGAAGYRMRVFETATRLCPRDLCSEGPQRAVGERLDRLVTDLLVIYLHLLLPPDLAIRVPAIDGTWSDFTSTTIGGRLRRLLGFAPSARDGGRRRDAPWRFARFLESIGGRGPTLHFIHVMLPHLPWRFLPSGKEYGPVGAPLFPHGVRQETWGADEWEVIQGFQRHLLQVGYVDRLIGELVAKLRQQNLYDPVLIVLVADHGAGFRVGQSRRGASATNFADILNVPLFVKLPEQTRGVRSDRNVETTDVLPTIAAALNLPLSWATDGQSALDSQLPQRSAKLTLEPTAEGGYLRRSWDIAALRTDRELSVARKLRRFGSGAEPGRLFRIGRRADLIGQRVADVLSVDSPGATEPELVSRLDQPWVFEDVDPTGSFLPAHITGRLHSVPPGDVPVDLAIAINGTIEAVTRTYDQGAGHERFTAMVREESLLAGRNLVEVLEIPERSATGKLRLTRQPDSASFTLAGKPGNEAIITANGSPMPLRAGRVDGAARIYRNRVGTWLSGWAATGRGQRPAETILVFIDGRLALAADNGLEPGADRVGDQDPWLRQAGFKIQLPGPLLTPESELRVIAVLDESASEVAIF